MGGASDREGLLDASAALAAYALLAVGLFVWLVLLVAATVVVALGLWAPFSLL